MNKYTRFCTDFAESVPCLVGCAQGNTRCGGWQCTTHLASSSSWPPAEAHAAGVEAFGCSLSDAQGCCLCSSGCSCSATSCPAAAAACPSCLFGCKCGSCCSSSSFRGGAPLSCCAGPFLLKKEATEGWLRSLKSLLLLEDREHGLCGGGGLTSLSSAGTTVSKSEQAMSCVGTHKGKQYEQNQQMLMRCAFHMAAS